VNRLKEIRLHFGLSQQELGNEVGENRSRINDMEGNRIKIQVDFAKKMQEKFKIDGWWLLTGEGEMLKKESPTPSRILENHIGDREMEIIEAFRSLSQGEQEVYYHEIKAKAARENLKNKVLSDVAKYA
jgi:transcriptional regulator with XRE-family HTH domain